MVKRVGYARVSQVASGGGMRDHPLRHSSRLQGRSSCATRHAARVLEGRCCRNFPERCHFWLQVTFDTILEQRWTRRGDQGGRAPGRTGTCDSRRGSVEQGWAEGEGLGQNFTDDGSDTGASANNHNHFGNTNKTRWLKQDPVRKENIASETSPFHV